MPRIARPLALGLLLWSASCVMRSGWDWHDVEVMLVVPQARGPLETSGTHGILSIRRIEVNVAGLELYLCDPVRPGVYAQAHSLWRAASSMPQAWAHLLDRELSLPLRHELWQETSRYIFLGTSNPPPGRYCGVNMLVGPDEDKSSSFVALGSLTHAEGRATEEFAWQSQARAHVSRPFDEPLEVEQGEDSWAVVELGWNLGRLKQALGSLDLATADRVVLARGALAAVAKGGLEVFVTKGKGTR